MACEFIAPQGVSTESEVSAKDVARIITTDQAAENPGGVHGDDIRRSRLMRRIAEETGAKIGGTLYLRRA